MTEKALRQIVKRAKEGDVAAVEWLERKHMLSFSPPHHLGPVGFVV